MLNINESVFEIRGVSKHKCLLCKTVLQNVNSRSFLSVLMSEKSLSALEFGVELVGF